jgi:hypothetical protein
VERRKQAHGRHGHFIGSWARLNCENMPVIPAWIVRSNLDDPRRIPYLLVWRDEREGEIKEAVRLTRYHDPQDANAAENYVELKRPDGDYSVLRIVWRRLPRNGGRALFLLCPHCDTLPRHFYGWEWNSFSGRSNVVRQICWRCRSCARLRYSSEGGYLRPLMVGLGSSASCFALLGETCHDRSLGFLYVFTSIDDPSLDEIVQHGTPLNP